MPMFFLGRDVDHIADGDLLLRGLGGNNAGPLRDEQDLITAMGMHFIAHPAGKFTIPKLKFWLISGVNMGCRLTSPVKSGLVAGSAGTALGLMTCIGLLLGVRRFDGLRKATGWRCRRARHPCSVVAQVDTIVHPREHVSQGVVGWAARWVTVPVG